MKVRSLPELKTLRKGLLTAAAGTPGPERLAQQYFRANVEP